MLSILFSRKVFLYIFALSLFIFFGHSVYTKNAIFADAKFYYATTRSLTKDFDIKFTNEFEKLGVKPTLTHKDYVWNKYPPGVSFIWMPAFILADGFSQLVSPLIPPQERASFDTLGYGFVHQTSAALTSMFLGVLGLYFLYLILKDYFSKKVSLLAVITLFATTNLLFYIAVEPINSHAVSFFISSLFVYYFLKKKGSKNYFLILGLIGGTAGLIRTQDILILMLPLIQILLGHSKSYKKLTTYLLQLTTGAFLGFLPQIIFWKLVFNTFWYSPYIEEGFNLLRPQILHVLINNQNGLFAITPSIAIAIAGLFLLKQKYHLLKLYSLAYFLLQLYLISSWSSFFQGGSYSIRMIITTYPLLVFGLAQIIEESQRKIKITKTVLVIGLVSLANSLFIIRYLLLY